MAKQLLHIDIQYLLRIRRVVDVLQSRQPKSMRENIHFICTPKYKKGLYACCDAKETDGLGASETGKGKSIYDKQILFTFLLTWLET